MSWARRKSGLRRVGLPGALTGALVIGAGVAGSALAAGSGPSGPVRLPPPPRLHAARDLGAVPANARMRVTIVLKGRDPAGLTALARAVSTPGSPVYHHFLTPAQFAERFGAPRSRVNAVVASLRAHGVVPSQASADRLAIPVTGSAAQIERAFSLSFRRKRLVGGRIAVVANAGPALDPGIAPDVQAVVGLTNVARPRPLMARGGLRPSAVPASSFASSVIRAAGDPPRACSSASVAAAAQGGYTADQIAAAYRFSDLYAGGAEGQGQTIAIYELEPFDPADIAGYQQCYGTSASVSSVPVDGGAGGGGPGSGEAALDIENVIGLAPKATVLVYSGPNGSQSVPGSGPYDTFSAIVNQDRARVVSVSWGECEQLQGSRVVGAENTLFEQAATQGQSIVSATGDEGSEDCNASNGLTDTELAVDDPGSQPFITGVGGTTMAAPGPPPAETVWNHAGNPTGSLAEQGGAGGGGVSAAWKMPGFQSGAAGSVHVIGPDSSRTSCGNPTGFCRQVPDVSADADPSRGYMIYWNGSGQDPTSPSGWQAVGGTSAAAPLWAALLADADSSAACHGSAIGFANPALYQAASTAYGRNLNDITSGDNDFTASHGGLYPAAPGYDMASGLGSPNAGALAASLCANALRVNTPGPQLTTVGQSVRLQVTTTALPGAKLSFVSSQLPPGLSISKATGLIQGRPTKIGRWLVGVAALDQSLSLRAAFFDWRVVGPPKVSQVALSGVGAAHPKLAMTVAAGRGAPALRALSVTLPRGLSFGRARNRVRVTGAGHRRIKFASRIVRGRLQITLSGALGRMRITIFAGALRVSRGLATQVRRKRRPALTISVRTIDLANRGLGARARIRPRG